MKTEIKVEKLIKTKLILMRKNWNWKNSVKTKKFNLKTRISLLYTHFLCNQYSGILSCYKATQCQIASHANLFV